MTSVNNQPPNDGLEQVRKQVREVEGIMKSNVDIVLERDGKLDQLDERAKRLEQETEYFHIRTTKLRKKYFWENTKMKIIIGVVIIVTIIIIIIIAVS